MARLLLTLAFGLLASAAKAGTITAPTWGWRDLETVARMNETILAGERRVAEAILGGDDCVWWTPGTRVEVIERDQDQDPVCLARPGRDRCSWTDRKARDIGEA